MPVVRLTERKKLVGEGVAGALPVQGAAVLHLAEEEDEHADQEQPAHAEEDDARVQGPAAGAAGKVEDGDEGEAAEEGGEAHNDDGVGAGDLAAEALEAAHEVEAGVVGGGDSVEEGAPEGVAAAGGVEGPGEEEEEGEEFKGEDEDHDAAQEAADVPVAGAGELHAKERVAAQAEAAADDEEEGAGVHGDARGRRAG